MNRAFLRGQVRRNNAGAGLIARTVYKGLLGMEFAGESPGPKDAKKQKPRAATVEKPGTASE